MVKHRSDGETDVQQAEDLRSVFAGRRKCDLLIRGARVVNLFSGRMEDRPVAVHRGRVIALEDLAAREIFVARGLCVAPGLVDSHIHIESSMLTPSEFARAVVQRGTTAVFADPHEIVNALGERGLRFMLEAAEGIPLDIFYLLPSCVPATPFETAGGVFTPRLLRKYRNHRRVVGLAEFMNVPGVLSGDRNCLEKIRLYRDGVIDGHAPLLSGEALSHYILQGMGSDHETTSVQEGREKLLKGMFLYLREGTSAKNLRDLLPLVTPFSADRFGFASDDLSPEDIARSGHIDEILRKAVRYGMDPLAALKIACMNPFRRFRLYDRGAVAPGYRADLVLFGDLKRFPVKGVLRAGRWIFREGSYQVDFTRFRAPSSLSDFEVPDPETLKRKIEVIPRGRTLRVIRLVERQILTEKEELAIDGRVPDPRITGRAKVVVVERHRGTGNVGVGFLAGLGLELGAIASTIAHDSHNLIAAGMDDRDILLAVETLRKTRGGIAVVSGGTVRAHLPLPVGGLMSDLAFEDVSRLHASLGKAAKSLGRRVIRHPFMHLSFVALPVIPHLRLTDRGLFDVDRFRFVPLSY
ncbi:MAG TPA: adenine deaminase [Syntrophales bacterium]|nr:adenine deaminase [Syntrophales bacterium]